MKKKKKLQRRALNYIKRKNKEKENNKENEKQNDDNIIKNLIPIPNKVHSTTAREILAEFEKEKKIIEEKEKKRKSKSKSRRFSNPKYRRARFTIKEEDEENEN